MICDFMLTGSLHGESKSTSVAIRPKKSLLSSYLMHWLNLRLLRPHLKEFPDFDWPLSSDLAG